VRRNAHPFRNPSMLAGSTLGLAVLLGSLGAAPTGGGPGRGPGGRFGPMKYKNVKVLKNLPPEQMIPAMRKISASLGVRCDFCHVEREFDRDDKQEKRTARAMLIMTQNLNAHEKIVDRKATCYMCHHGHAQPETQAPEQPFGGGRPRPMGGGDTR
jgi:photosynthetic reaction center cytochrome c subunit